MEASSRLGTASMIRMLMNIPFARGSLDELTAVPHIAQPWATASGAARKRTAAASAAARTALPRKDLCKVHHPEERDPDRADEPPVDRRDPQRRTRRAQSPGARERGEQTEPHDGAEDVQAVRADQHEEHPAVDPVHDLHAVGEEAHPLRPLDREEERPEESRAA